MNSNETDFLENNLNEENDSFKHLIVANHSQNKLLTGLESLNIRAKEKAKY